MDEWKAYCIIRRLVAVVNVQAGGCNIPKDSAVGGIYKDQ